MSKRSRPRCEQRFVHRQRIGGDKIRRAGDQAGVDRRIFKRINRAVHGLNRFAARDGAGRRQLRTDAVREKAVRLLRPQFQLPVHVRENFDGRLARHAAAKAGDADDRRAERRANQNDGDDDGASVACPPPVRRARRRWIRAVGGFRSREFFVVRADDEEKFVARDEFKAFLAKQRMMKARQFVQRDHPDERAERGGQHEQNIRRHHRHRRC